MQVSGVGSVGSASFGRVARLLSRAYLDPRDTNQDGVVSPAESLAYSLSHPLADALTRLESPRSQPNHGRTTPGLFDPLGSRQGPQSRIDWYV